MPTAEDILDAAFLSNLAYFDNPSLGQGSWTVLSRTQLGLSQAGWDNDLTDADNSQFLFDNLNAQGIVAQKATRLRFPFADQVRWATISQTCWVA